MNLYSDEHAETLDGGLAWCAEYKAGYAVGYAAAGTLEDQNDRGRARAFFS
jgi:hypothetical protein